jgi:peroxiredoxin
MELALVFVKALLVATFLVAGAAKLVDRKGTQEGIEGFGVPEVLARPGSIVLPLAELAIAFLLLPAATAWIGSIGALGLLGAFTAGIGINLARGRTPDCHCFGQVYSKPIGRETLIRNGVLMGGAGFVAVQGPAGTGPGIAEGVATLPPLVIVGLVAGLAVLAAVTLATWMIVRLLRQHGRLLLRIEELERRLAGGTEAAAAEPPAAEETPPPGIPLGTPAPAFTLSGLYGETLTLDALRAAGKPLLLVFTDPGCGPCNALLPELGAWNREHSSAFSLVPVSRGSVEANRAKSAEHGLSNVLLQNDREVQEAYLVQGTPTAVLVNPDGMIGSPLSAGADQIRALVARAAVTANPTASVPPAPARESTAVLPVVPSANGSGNGHVHDHDHDHAQAGALAFGDPAPTVKLPDLKGRSVNLAGMRGSPTAVLFWSPTCGFCTRMLDDVKAWEKEHPEDAPKLLVVSSGTAELNRAQGFSSPVVLEQDFATGNLFGARGTPSAILVDKDGKIASSLAVGGPAVLSLIGAKSSATDGNGAAAQAAAPPAAQLGDPAPDISLPDLAGKTVTLAELKGRDTALLFWNPGCGFCQRMSEDLKAWERARPSSAPELVIVSTGTKEANEAFGLTSPVLLDQGFTVASRFGANGTPMAVLLDKDGKVASPVAAGAPGVLALLNRDRSTATAGA